MRDEVYICMHLHFIAVQRDEKRLEVFPPAERPNLIGSAQYRLCTVKLQRTSRLILIGIPFAANLHWITSLK